MSSVFSAEQKGELKQHKAAPKNKALSMEMQNWFMLYGD